MKLNLNIKTKVNTIKSIDITSNKFLLFAGCIDSKIYVFGFEDNNINKLCVLEGSEDWIRCLSICKFESSYYLASGSQDNRIRIHIIKCFLNDESLPSEDRDTKIFKFIDKYYLISLESVLYGHSDWITGLDLISPQLDIKYPILFSCSMDKTIQVWHPESINNSIIWDNDDILGDSNSHSLGYYSIKCQIINNEIHLISSDYKGQFNYYERVKNDDICIYL